MCFISASSTHSHTPNTLTLRAQSERDDVDVSGSHKPTWCRLGHDQKSFSVDIQRYRECESVKPSQINNPCECKLAIDADTSDAPEKKDTKTKRMRRNKVSPVESFLIEFYDTHLLRWHWRWGMSQHRTETEPWMEQSACVDDTH